MPTTPPALASTTLRARAVHHLAQSPMTSAHGLWRWMTHESLRSLRRVKRLLHACVPDTTCGSSFLAPRPSGSQACHLWLAHVDRPAAACEATSGTVIGIARLLTTDAPGERPSPEAASSRFTELCCIAGVAIRAARLR